MKSYFTTLSLKWILFIAILSSTLGVGSVQATHFNRGDLDSNGKVELTDAILTLEYSLLGVYFPTCISSGDANDDGKVDISDTIYLLSYIFRGTAEPPAPFRSCEPDPTPDQLSCESYESCPQVSPTITILGRLLFDRSPETACDFRDPDSDCDGLSDGVVLVNDRPVITESDGTFIVTIPRGETRGGDHDKWIVIESMSSPIFRNSTNSTTVEIYDEFELYPVELVVTPNGFESTKLVREGRDFRIYQIDKDNGLSASITVRGSNENPLFEPATTVHTNAIYQGLSSPGTPGQGTSATLEEPSEANNFSGVGDHDSVSKIEVYIFDENTGLPIPNSDAEVDITLFTPTKNLNDYQDGEVLSMFHFDPENNLWVEKGEASITINEEGIEARTTVNELGWWSLGRRIESTCNCGGIEFEDDWSTPVLLGTEGITYSGFNESRISGRGSRNIIRVRTRSNTNDTAYLTARFGNTERFYLMNAGNGVLELTRNKEEAIIINSQSREVCRGESNIECGPPRSLSTKKIDASSPVLYQGIASSGGSGDDPIELEGYHLLRSGEVVGVNWSSEDGTFSDPNSRMTTFTPRTFLEGDGEVEITYTISTPAQGDFNSSRSNRSQG